LFQSKYKKKEENEKIQKEPIVDAFINEHDISGLAENNGTGMNMLTEENPTRLAQNEHTVSQITMNDPIPNLL